LQQSELQQVGLIPVIATTSEMFTGCGWTQPAEGQQEIVGCLLAHQYNNANI
jgi:hypothetical protein